MDLLEKAKNLEFNIAQIEKQIQLYSKVIDLFAAQQALPKLGVQVNPQFPGNVMWFDPKFSPLKNDEVLDGYIKNMKGAKELMEVELKALFK